MAFAAARMIIQREAREHRKSMDCSAFRGGEVIRGSVEISVYFHFHLCLQLRSKIFDMTCFTTLSIPSICWQFLMFDDIDIISARVLEMN